MTQPGKIKKNLDMQNKHQGTRFSLADYAEELSGIQGVILL